jgi:hypothetical protein
MNAHKPKYKLFLLVDTFILPSELTTRCVSSFMFANFNKYYELEYFDECKRFLSLSMFRTYLVLIYVNYIYFIIFSSSSFFKVKRSLSALIFCKIILLSSLMLKAITYHLYSHHPNKILNKNIITLINTNLSIKLMHSVFN